MIMNEEIAQGRTFMNRCDDDVINLHGILLVYNKNIQSDSYSIVYTF